MNHFINQFIIKDKNVLLTIFFRWSLFILIFFKILSFIINLFYCFFHFIYYNESEYILK